MKKLISAALILSLLLGATCFALTPEDAAADLGKYGILNGFPDGSLRLEENITRAQMTKMLVTAMNEQILPGAVSLFSDVPKGHWATPHIALAQSLDIVGGFPNGTFKPDDNVTCEQALKMIVCVLKYDKYVLSQRVNATELVYPMDYIDIARKNGLIEGLIFEVGTPATRGFVALVLSRALDLPLAYDTNPSPFAPDYEQQRAFAWQFKDGKDGRAFETLRTVLEK